MVEITKENNLIDKVFLSQKIKINWIEDFFRNIKHNSNFESDVIRLLICYKFGFSWKTSKNYVPGKYDKKKFRVM